MLNGSCLPIAGLSLVIFVEQYDYVPILTEAVGARVVIHNQTDMPFPEQNGISLTTGTLVNVGIKKVGLLLSRNNLRQNVELSSHAASIYFRRRIRDWMVAMVTVQ